MNQQFCPHLFLFGQLLNVSPTNHIYSEISNSEFSYIEVRFNDQNPVPPEIEDSI